VLAVGREAHCQSGWCFHSNLFYGRRRREVPGKEWQHIGSSQSARNGLTKDSPARATIVHRLAAPIRRSHSSRLPRKPSSLYGCRNRNKPSRDLSGKTRRSNGLSADHQRMQYRATHLDKILRGFGWFVQWRFPLGYLNSGSPEPVTRDSIGPFASAISSGNSIL
jgi:hypothetical protein